MEQFVLGIFQEQLSKFLVGFRKEQVNANLLNGKGEIRDVNLNCSIINNLISRVTPFIILESIRVSKLSFNVTSWTNIKKAPICVVIEDVFVNVVEPLNYVDDSQRLTCRQVSREEFKKMMEGKKARGPYNLFDRILDNLQIEIRSVNISFQTMGKFKTQRPGPWTPPRLRLSLRHFKYCSVNECGNEANPDECWQHNKNTGRASDRELLIYKRVSMNIDLSFEDNETSILSELINDAPVNVQIIFNKKVSNGAILGIQLDAAMDAVEINIEQDAIPIIAHAMAGFQYCVSKNRAFVDPLRYKDSQIAEASAESQVSQTLEIQSSNEIEMENFDEKIVALGFDDSVHGNMSADGTLGKPLNPESSSQIINQEIQNANVDKMAASDTSNSRHGNEKDFALAPGASVDAATRMKEPVLVLPSGIIIHKKLSISFSIQTCRVKGNYSKSGSDYIQLQTEGLVAEMIWPKTTREKGGYIQLSLASLKLEEMHDKKLRVMLRGGTCHDDCAGPLEFPKAQTPLVSRDENFPLFEDRCIQPDPLGLRHSFPSQALGCKATINFIEKVSDPNEDDILVENEIGVDQLHIILDSASWCRAICFGSNKIGGGFDPRWYTGDWNDSIGVNAMINPAKPIVLSDHCQQMDQIFLDDNKYFSSDLLNITVRFSRVSIELPAMAERDILSCTIVLELEELMVLVSSTLPRTSLTGKIGSLIENYSEGDTEAIQFPNDPSDLCYSSHMAEDHVIRQHGTERKFSTFRSQITTRGLALKITPTIPYCNASEPQEFISPLEMTMLVCFEGEPPITPQSDSTNNIVFTSVKIHRLNINFDVDLIAGGISTVLFHSSVINESLALLWDTSESKSGNEDDKDRGQEEGTSSRRSGSTGGPSIEFSVQVAYFGMHLWKQNVTLSSNFRKAIIEDRKKIDECPIPFLKLFSFDMNNVELGFEATMQKVLRRIIKVSVSQIDLRICNFEESCIQHLHLLDEGIDVRESLTEEVYRSLHLLSILSFGSPNKQDIAVRVEDKFDAARSISYAADLDVGGSVTAHMHEIEMVFLLVVESLLMPINAKIPFDTSTLSQNQFQFPDDSIGFLFMKLAGGCSIGAGKTQQPTESSSIDFSKIFHESNSFHHFMDKLFVNILPDNTDRFLFHLDLGDFSLHIPHPTTNKIVCDRDTPWVGYKINSAQLLSKYIGEHTDRSENSIMDTLGTRNRSWNELLVDCDSGFYHKIRAVQEVYSAEVIDTEVKTKTDLIDSFEIAVNCSPCKIDVSLGASSISVENLAHVKSFRASLHAFLNRFKVVQYRVGSVVKALTNSTFGNINDSDERESNDTKNSENAITFMAEAESSLRQGRIYVERFFRELQVYDSGMRTCIREKEEEIHRLRAQIFLKERSRVAALALVSCETAGWLRVGGMHIAGQRAPTVANMWRYYAVLRKSLLILYSGPGQTRPLDVIYLAGARILELTGGKRKMDVKDGFGIKERRSNCTRFFLAPDSAECEIWTRQIHNAITTFSPDDLSEQSDSDETQSSINNEKGFSASRSNGSLVESNGRGKKVRERLHQVTASARSIGSAIQARRQRLYSQESESPSEMTEYEGTSITNNDDDTLQKTATFESGTNSLDDEKAVEIEGYENSTSTSDHNITAQDNFNQTKANAGTDNSLLESSRQRANTHDSGSSKEFLEFSDAASTCKKNNVESSNKKVRPENVTDDPPSTSTSSVINPLTNNNPPGTLDQDKMESNNSMPGSRFASMRANAKNRFGSAMQGAREKALAVAEERRRRKQDREDTHLQEDVGDSSYRKSFSLRDRLENVANNVKNKMEQNEVGVLSNQTEQRINNEKTIAPRGLRTEAAQIATSENDSAEDFSEDLNTSAVGQQIRNKFSQIGSAVKSARQPNQTLKPGTNVERDETPPRNSRFSIRRGNLKFPEESDMVKLKAVRVAAGYKVREPDINSPSGRDTLLAKIKGNWLIYVKLGETDEKTCSTSGEAKYGVARTLKESAAVSSGGASIGDSISSFQVAEDSNHPPCGTLPSNHKLCYTIKIVSYNKEKSNKMIVSEITRDFNEVVALFIDVMESVALLPHAQYSNLIQEVRDGASDMESDLASSLGLAPIDIVKVTGDLLGGLLSSSSSFHSIADYNSYICEILSEFLNATLSCPLPMEACIAVLEFLDLVDAGTVPVGSKEEDNEDDTVRSKLIPSQCAEANASTDSIGDILALKSPCLSHLSRASLGDMMALKAKETETYNTRGKEFEDSNISQISTVNSRDIKHLRPSPPTDVMNIALQEALMDTMRERDDIQAHLLASTLMHAHQIECERKNVESMKKKLILVEQKDPARDRRQGLFSERTNEASTINLQKHFEKQLEESEQEIHNLNKQVAKEVSEKAQATLEIERLKQMQQLEKKSHALEMKKLVEELNEVRKQLDEAASIAQAAGIER